MTGIDSQRAPDIATGSPDRFGYSWQAFADLSPEQFEQFRRWTALLGSQDWQGKSFLDVGCGGGRNSHWALDCGAASGVAIDVDEGSQALARRRFANDPRVEVAFVSAYDIPWTDRFDIVFSIGVVHHLEDPALALRRMAQAAKPGGRVLVWLYGRENNGFVVHVFDPLRRALFSRLPVAWMQTLAWIPAAAVWACLRLGLGQIAYYRMLRRFPIRHLHHIIFDHMIPRIARYYRRNDVEALMRGAGLQDVRLDWVNEMSWAAVGTKPR
jgi:SAM-dependent methyltransferase